MAGRIALMVVALACQANAQVLVDNFDPRVPRPGAALPASIDPYGFSRPLPPSIDPLGVSYRPAHAGAVLPALYDPLGASRPGGLPFALDPVGYTRTGGNYGGGYGGYGGTYDSFLARPSGFVTGVGGSPIFPDPNGPAALLAARVPGTPLPPPTVAMPVLPVSAVPIASVASVAPVPQVSYPLNPVPSFSGGALTSATFPTSNLPFGSGGSSALPNLASPVPLNPGNLQLGTTSRPLASGSAVSGGSSSSIVPNASYLPPI